MMSKPSSVSFRLISSGSGSVRDAVGVAVGGDCEMERSGYMT